MNAVADDFEYDYKCPICGSDIYQVGILEYCNNKSCDWEDRIGCCEDCAGISDYYDDEEV